MSKTLKQQLAHLDLNNHHLLQEIEVLRKYRDELAHTLNTIINHGLPAAMLEGSHQFKLIKERDAYRKALEYYSLGFSHGQGSKDDVRLVSKPTQQINIQKIMFENDGTLPPSAYIHVDEPLNFYGEIARQVLAKYPKKEDT